MLKKSAARIGTAMVASLALIVFGLLSVACTDSAPNTVDAILLPPPAVPAPLSRTTSHVRVHLVASEVEKEIAPGVKYKLWTFNDTVPGPLIRVHVGDTVELSLTNNTSNMMTHNIDLHAVNGPGGGAPATDVAPGETRTFTFKALSAGLFTYHCAAGIVADHIANGMYGGILVEPSNGLPAVDHEYYIGQSDLYTTGETGEQGNQDLSIPKLLAEQPTYVVFNGNTKSLVGNNALQAKVGDTVRIYFVDGGPNLTSSLHVIGEIFDKAWAWGSLESLPAKGVQTITTPPGGASIVQFKIDVPGDYKIVDHAISRVSKGAVGIITATGKENPDIFEATGGIPTGGTASPTPAASAVSVADGGSLKITMKDNAFDSTSLETTAGAKVTFDLENTGKLPHNMRIAPLDGNFDSPDSVVTNPEIVNPGKSGTLQWAAPTQPGTYKFRCDIHPTEMTGTIQVK
ncbi:MAG: copper-containing nitrite reductase [Dehalococcoidia bacterium]